MSNHQIGAWQFVHWEGMLPQFVRNHSTEFTKPGQNGISVISTGRFGEAFQARMHSVFPNQSLARNAEWRYRDLILTIQIVIYDGTNYASQYGHRYYVKSVVPVENRAHVRLVGPTYDYLGGWKLISDWTMIPVQA